MKAVRIHAYGGVDQLRLEEIPDPTPGPGEVLVENEYASVNPLDCKLRGGSRRLVLPLKFPAVLGFDLAGRVKAVGADVTAFKVGDEVFGRSGQQGGRAYAELVALNAGDLAEKPAGLSTREAAAIPHAALTALQALRDKAGLKPGASVLVNGASGGVGVYAIQIARALGAARVSGVCSAANAELVRGLGADDVIDYKSTDPVAGNEQYDVIFDCVASLSYGRATRALRKGGAYVTTLPHPSLLWAALRAVFSGKKAALVVVKTSGTDVALLGRYVEAGKLRAVIDSEFALADIARAHEKSESGRARGKLLVKIR